MYDIQHNPKLDIERVAKIYSEKDGVDVRYVCTSATTEYAAYAEDIFYRETPHPEFGNRYFGLYWSQHGNLMISNADTIETVTFGMIEVDGKLHYSQHRHDYRSLGDVFIDGGRAYVRRGGNLSRPVVILKVKNGEFVSAED
jgi:hypothetical protein